MLLHVLVQVLSERPPAGLIAMSQLEAFNYSH